MIGLNDEENPSQEANAPEEAAEQSAQDYAAEIAELKRKNDEYIDKLMRLQADFENYRKRAAKERDDIVQLSTARLVKELLTLVDSFDRALATTKAGDCSSDAQGLRMMYAQLMDILKSEGVAEIDTNGRLDPFQHEVMTKRDEPGREEDEIVECIQKGYKMKGRVLRPARVVVCKREEPEESEKRYDEKANQDDSDEPIDVDTDDKKR